MKLLDALRLEAPPKLALVGSGGKTTALFQLARQLCKNPLYGASRKTVLVTATTNFATDEVSWADHHFALNTIHDLVSIEKELPSGILLFTGQKVEPERIAGLSGLLLDRIYQMAQEHRLPLLIEADRSNRHLLKAPADHEPLIPSWVEQVVVVAGLSALGRPLNEEWVQHVERFSELAQLSRGDLIDPEAVARELNSTRGGLKSIPKSAHRLALLNQADTIRAQSDSVRLAELLLPNYTAVIVAALNSLHLNSHSRVFALHEPIAGIILAAGESRRFGSPKQILSWRGQPFVRHIARVALTAGLSPVVVISGYAAPQVHAAVQDMPVICQYNSDWLAGQSTSVVAGIEALPASVGGTLIMLVDQPQISVNLVRSLIDLHARSNAPLVAPLIDGKRANPVLFDCSMFKQLESVTGDIGGRSLFAHNPVSWLPWIDSMAAFDVDTPAEYQRLLDGSSPE